MYISCFIPKLKKLGLVLYRFADKFRMKILSIDDEEEDLAAHRVAKFISVNASEVILIYNKILP